MIGALPAGRRSYAARKDTSQAGIVAELKRAGASVQVLNDTAKGVPDLVVGWCGANYLLECKTPGRKGGLENSIGTRAKQLKWHREWRGQVETVWTPEQALQAIGVLRK